MDLTRGFQIEEPNVLVRWGISEKELVELLGTHGLRPITGGYYTISCSSLGGLRHELGFHFTPRAHGRLTELEFFRRTAKELQSSFAEFQHYFEKNFGPPAQSADGLENFPSHKWLMGPVEIVHYVIDRFGPEEHMRIRR